MTDVPKQEAELTNRRPRRGLRRFRLWEKKRGSRRTGSSWWGGAGETLFFGSLFLLGALTLTELVVFWMREDPESFLASTWGVWLSVLLLGSLVIVGAVGSVYSAVLTGTSAERRAAIAKRATTSDLLADSQQSSRNFPCVPKDTNWKNSPGIRLAYRLPIASSPAWRLVFMSTLCLLWNGAVAVLLVLSLNQTPRGGFGIADILSPEGWTTFRFTVVVYSFIGVGMVYFLFRMLIAAAAIGPTSVEVSTQPFQPGGNYSVYLTQAGHLKVIWLELRLVCEEEASFSDGTDTRTESARVYDRVVFRQEDFEILPSEPFQHECPLDVPASAMHSFLSTHNAVVWKIEVRANAKKWPMFERTFPVVLYPQDTVPS